MGLTNDHRVHDVTRQITGCTRRYTVNNGVYTLVHSVNSVSLYFTPFLGELDIECLILSNTDRHRPRSSEPNKKSQSRAGVFVLDPREDCQSRRDTHSKWLINRWWGAGLCLHWQEFLSRRAGCPEVFLKFDVQPYNHSFRKPLT